MTNTEVNLINTINRDTFIVSDNHFGHKNVVTFEPSRITATQIDGFETQEEMMIDRHNQVVSDDDTVIFLGDFAFNRIKHWMSQLNGNKILILGNHDKQAHVYQQQGLCTVIDGIYKSTSKYLMNYTNIGDHNTSGLIKMIDGHNIMFSHYSLYDQNDYDMRQSYIQKQMRLLQSAYETESCEINMHGHLHSYDSIFKDSINCSIECLDFYPTKIGALLDKHNSKGDNNEK